MAFGICLASGLVKIDFLAEVITGQVKRECDNLGFYLFLCPHCMCAWGCVHLYVCAGEGQRSMLDPPQLFELDLLLSLKLIN